MHGKAVSQTDCEMGGEVLFVAGLLPYVVHL